MVNGRFDIMTEVHSKTFKSISSYSAGIETDEPENTPGTPFEEEK